MESNEYEHNKYRNITKGNEQQLRNVERKGITKQVP